MSDSYRPSHSPTRALTNGYHNHNHYHRPASTLPPAPPSLPTPSTISEEAKSTIDLLKTTYKKRGHFDSLRKDIYQSFTDSETKLRFITALEKIADAEIDRDPSLLARDKGKAAELIEATVLRGETYGDVEKAVEELLAGRRAEIEEMLRGIMEEQGLLLKEEGGKGGSGGDGKDGDGDADMVEAVSGLERDRERDRDREREKDYNHNHHPEPSKPSKPPKLDRKLEDVVVPPKRVSRFDDTIGLHLKNRNLDHPSPTTNSNGVS